VIDPRSDERAGVAIARLLLNGERLVRTSPLSAIDQ